MPRYIDAEEFKNGVMAAMTEESAKDGSLPLYIGMMLCHFADDTPTADVQEVKHGKYLQGCLDGDWYCNLCNDRIFRMTIPEYRYCPNCGARMDGDEK